MDQRAVMRALVCDDCGAVPGGLCLSSSGGASTRFHKARQKAAAALSPEEQAAVVAKAAADRQARLASLDAKPLTADQTATRERVSAEWTRILEEAR